MTNVIVESYELIADSEKATGMKSYMRNQFEFFGIPRPERKVANTILLKEVDALPVNERIKLVRNLWKAPQRELQYFAMEAISRKKKEWPPNIHLLFDEMLLKKSWWDTVDFIAVNLCGPYLELFPEMKKQKLADWTGSKSFWMHRTAILYQLKYKARTDEKLLFTLCRRYAGEKEFFIRKAIGWSLREYSKTAPAKVRNLFREAEFSPLSVKEGSKYL